MRRRTTGADRRRPLPELKITPSMRRKVETAARWIAGGDASQLRLAQAAIVELLLNAARKP